MVLRAALTSATRSWSTAPKEQLNELAREALRREVGERHWHERFMDARLGPSAPTDWQLMPAHLMSAEHESEEASLRQETLRWYEDWFRNAQIGVR